MIDWHSARAQLGLAIRLISLVDCILEKGTATNSNISTVHDLVGRRHCKVRLGTTTNIDDVQLNVTSTVLVYFHGKVGVVKYSLVCLILGIR
jgi:hypothetical protein